MASTLAARIIGVLAGSVTGLTVDDISKQLYPPPININTAVQQRGDLITALAVLKAEHRAWPTGDRWKLTSRGKGSS